MNIHEVAFSNPLVIFMWSRLLLGTFLNPPVIFMWSRLLLGTFLKILFLYACGSIYQDRHHCL